MWVGCPTSARVEAGSRAGDFLFSRTNQRSGAALKSTGERKSSEHANRKRHFEELDLLSVVGSIWLHLKYISRDFFVFWTLGPMSRFNNNRGGMGMNNFQPRRGGGVGGPMRGGLMGNPNMRSHPFQNQNRRGLNNNFNRQPNQGPPQTPPKQQNQPIIPPPSPGPALTMKGPMEQQKATEKEQGPIKQQTPAPPSTIQPPPAKTNITSSQHQESKNQDQQLKSPIGNANGQQQKQPPQASPKSTPQQPIRPSLQQPLRPGPQQGQRPGLQQGQRPGLTQGQRSGQQQGQRLGPQQGQRSGQQQGQKTAPMAMKRADGQETMDNPAAQSEGSQAKVGFRE